jgi:hypothetical protein
LLPTFLGLRKHLLHSDTFARSEKRDQGPALQNYRR